jgi:hypothetical protein
VALLITNVSEDRIASTNMVTKIGETGKTSAATIKRSTLQSSSILVTLMMRRYIPLKRRFLQEPCGVTSQKTAFFTVTAAKT